MFRVRYFFFLIINERVDVWFSCMKDVMDYVGLEGDICEFLFGWLELIVRYMVN